MSLEQKLISTLASSREAFDKLHGYLDNYEWSMMGSLFYQCIDEYYLSDSAVISVDWDIVKPLLVQELGPKKEAVVHEYISTLPEPASLPNVLKLFEDARKEKLRFQLMQALSRSDDPLIEKLIEEYQSFSIEEQVEEMYNATSIEDLSSHFTGHNLIPIYPTGLNSLIGGGVPRQSQLCIFARPDVGKSVFVINLAVGAAENGFKVLYIGNEDPPAKMMYRILTRFTRQPEHVLKGDPSRWFDEAIKNGYGNLFFIPMHPGTYREIRKKIEQLKPDIVVVDQIRNVLFDKDSLTVNLEKACKSMRNLAKEFNFVSVLVTQAGESAEGKLFLDMTDVDSSKTGLQGTMDLIIGIGQKPELKQRGQVVLNFPKNKLSSPLKPMTVNIEYEINRILT